MAYMVKHLFLIFLIEEGLKSVGVEVSFEARFHYPMGRGLQHKWPLNFYS